MAIGRRAGWGILAAVVVGAWTLLQWRLSRIVVAGNADDANTVLAGLEQWRGHVLLHGWTMPADSFVTGDVPLAGLLATLFGLGPWLFQAVPVTLAAITLVIALRLSARGSQTPGLALFPSAIALGLPGVLATDFWLQSPMHVSTVAYCLAAFGFLTGPATRRRWAAGAACLILAGVGDATAFAIGAAPVALLGLRLLLVPARRRRGLGLLLVALSAAGVSEALLALRGAVGAFRSAPQVPVVPVHLWAANAWHGLARFFQLTAAFSGVAGPAGVVEHVVRLVMTGALLAGAGAGLVALAGRAPLPDGDARRDLLGLLGVAGAASYGVFCLLSPAGAPQATTRYLLPLLVTSAVALGVLGGSIRLPPRRTLPAAVAGAVVAGAYLAMPVRTAAGPLPLWPAASAVRWLAAGDLYHGVGTYWDASYLTVESGGTIVVRPVSAPHGRLVPYLYFADASWFSDPRLAHPGFAVFEGAAPWGGVDSASATATYGRPVRYGSVGPYTVVVWANLGSGSRNPDRGG